MRDSGVFEREREGGREGRRGERERERGVRGEGWWCVCARVRDAFHFAPPDA